MNKITFMTLLSIFFLFSCGGGSDENSVEDDTYELTPIVGNCGDAAQEYDSDETSWDELSFCAQGVSSVFAIAFPEHGESVSWFCSGENGGGGESCSASRKPLEVDSTSTAYNYIELGFVSDSEVSILSVDGVHLFGRYTTDSNGAYQPNKKQIADNVIDILGEMPEYLLVTSKNGTDTDPDDDGNVVGSEMIDVLGQVKAIYSSDDFFSKDEISANLISTAIAELVDLDKLSKEHLSSIAIKIGMEDVNGDGLVDHTDVDDYKMVAHQAKAEGLLREKYLNSVHENDRVQAKEALQEISDELFLANISTELIGDRAFLTITPLSSNRTPYYAVNPDNGEELDTEFSSPIPLSKNDYAAYTLCKDRTCGPISVVSYDGIEVKLLLSKRFPETIYESTSIANDIRDRVNTNYPAFTDIERQLVESSIMLDDIVNRMADIDAEIEDIEEPGFL